MPNPALLAAMIALPALPAAFVAGDDPPPGAPWLRSYREAKLDALANGRPVFVYFTKTY
jgi:hypothetical protein